MTTQEITLNLPTPLYEQIRRAAEKTSRSVDQVLIEVVLAAAPTLDRPGETLRTALAQLAYLNDAALWQAARSTMLPEQSRRMEELHNKQQSTSLSTKEQEEDQKLLALHRETVLVRAQSAVVLNQRGYDISNPLVFSPLV